MDKLVEKSFFFQNSKVHAKQCFQVLRHFPHLSISTQSDNFLTLSHSLHPLLKIDLHLGNCCCRVPRLSFRKIVH